MSLTCDRYWEGVDGWGGVPCLFSSLSLSLCWVCYLSPQAPCLLWSISTPSSHWPCPANWSFQAEVGNTPSCCLPRMEPGQRKYREPLPHLLLFFKEKINCPLINRLFSKVLWLFKKFHTEFSEQALFSERGQSHEDYILVHEKTSSVR